MSATTEPRIEVSCTVPTTPDRVFVLLADPRRHPGVDGSGTVRAAGSTGALAAVGDVFVMHMHHERIGDHDVENVVIVHEPDRALGWTSAPLGEEPPGQTWTWRLHPAGAEATTVTLTYDWSAVTVPRLLPLLPMVSREELEESLRRLADELQRAAAR